MQKWGIIDDMEARSSIQRREACHMRTSLVAMSAAGVIGGANETTPVVQEV